MAIGRLPFVEPSNGFFVLFNLGYTAQIVDSV